MGSEQHLMTPLWRDPRERRERRDPSVNAKKLDVDGFYDEFAHLGVQFPIKSRRRPEAAQGAPKGSHRYRRMAKGTPKDGQSEPKGTQE